MIVGFIISLWRKFKKTFRKDEYFVFWSSLFFYFLLFFNLNNKTLILAFALFIFVLFLKFKNLSWALFWGFIASFPIAVGKTYFVEMIPADQLYRSDNPEGYFLKLVVTPSTIIVLFLLPLLLGNLLRCKRQQLYLDSIWLFLFLLTFLVFISTFTSQNPPVSFFFFLQFLEQPVSLLSSRYLIKWDEEKKDMLLLLLLSQVVFEGILVLLQFVRGGPLGISIESYRGIVPFGKGVDEDVWRYRPTGTFDHANFVAAFLLPLAILNFAYFYRQRVKSFDYFLLSFTFIVAILTLAITLSRSAWISLILGIILLTYILEKRYHLKIQEFYRKRFALIIFFILLTVPFFIGPRVVSTFNTFVRGGSLFTRIELIQESLKVINQNPILGTGLAMSVPEMFKNNPRGIMYSFPTPVHNWYLNFASEVGIPALLMFLFLLNFCFKRVFMKNNQEVFFIGAFVAILVMLVNGIFQPFLGNEALLFIILGIFSARDVLNG